MMVLGRQATCTMMTPAERTQLMLAFRGGLRFHERDLGVIYRNLEATYGGNQMSELTALEFNLNSATAYNAKYATRNGWYGNIPLAALEEYPCLGHDPVKGPQSEKERFASDVWAFQKAYFSDDVAEQDGKLGHATWTGLLQVFDTVPDEERYVLFKGRRYPTEDAEIISYEDPNGYDLHRAGNYNKREDQYDELVECPTCIVLHWGGSTVRGLYNYFKDPARDLSTHFGVGPDGAYQMLDIYHRAWHAADANSWAVGIDICQQPTTNYLDYYLGKGYDIEVVENPTDRGDDLVLTIEPQTADHVKNLVFELCRVLDIPLISPGAHDVIGYDPIRNGDFRGVCGHHHLKSSKWDQACWWRQIFKNTELDI